MRSRHRSLFPALLATCLSLALCGCIEGANPVRDIAVASGVTGGEPKPAPDFVSRTRSGRTEFVPVGTDAPRRAMRPKSAAEVSEAEAELERVRARNEARGGGARAAPAR